MDIYIYFGTTKEIDIDELEENIEEILQDNGEVTGCGRGINGGNIDIELLEETELEFFLCELKKLNFPEDTYLVIDGKRRNLYNENSYGK